MDVLGLGLRRLHLLGRLTGLITSTSAEATTANVSTNCTGHPSKKTKSSTSCAAFSVGTPKSETAVSGSGTGRFEVGLSRRQDWARISMMIPQRLKKRSETCVAGKRLEERQSGGKNLSVFDFEEKDLFVVSTACAW